MGRHESQFTGKPSKFLLYLVVNLCVAGKFNNVTLCLILESFQLFICLPSQGRECIFMSKAKETEINPEVGILDARAHDKN